MELEFKMQNKISTRMLKKVLCVFMATLMVLSPFLETMSVFATGSRSVLDSGTIGENISYVLYDNGELIISGEGPITEEGRFNAELGDVIKNIIINSGVTSIGDRVFCGCINLQSITIPKSVTHISDEAFFNCEHLSKVYYEGSIEDWKNIDGHTYVEGLPGITIIYQNSSNATSGNITGGNITGGNITGGNITGGNITGGNISDGNITRTINVGETITVDVKKGKKVYIKFVPTVSGAYQFYSSSSSDTYGYLYDFNMNELASDDDNGTYRNFNISYNFKAGKVYYFGVRYFNSSNFGSFDVTLECDHDYIYTVTKEATCSENGVETVTCSRCDYTEYNLIPKERCTDIDGNLICDICGNEIFRIAVGETKTIDVMEGEKVYIAFKPTVSGIYKFTSNADSDSDTYGYLYDANFEELTSDDDDGKDYNFLITYNFEAGKVYYFGAKYYSSYDSGSFDVNLECVHDGDWTIVTEATCTTVGSRTCVCVQCGKVITEETPTISHNYELTETVPATCTEDGYEKYDCTGCDDYYTNTLYSSGHNYIYTVTKEATCTETGKQTVTCSKCDYSEENEIAKIKCTDENNDYICDVCGNEIPYITLGETKTVEVGKGETVYIKYIPSVSGTHEFYSTASADTYGYLYDADMNCLESNDDGGKNNNFLLTYDFEVGKVYYFGVRYYYSSNSGSFDVTLECSHIDTDCDGICEKCGLSSIVASGTCGENLVWNIYGTTLVISGDGEMDDYYTDSRATWYPYTSKITNIIIRDGVTSIGSTAFADCYSVTDVTIPDSVTSIGCLAFCSCTRLKNITLPGSIKVLGYQAFDECYNLEKIIINSFDCEIPDSEYSIYYDAVIYGHKNSTAQAYAEEYGRNFVVIPCKVVHVDAKDPTCTEKGNIAHYSCSVCGLCYSDESGTNGIDEVDVFIDELGHDYSEWAITTEPTCTNKGVEKRTCSRCDNVESRTVEALGHTVGELTEEVFPTCTEEGYTKAICSACGEELVNSVAALGHAYSDEWEIAQELTCVTDGIKVKSCTACGEKSGLFGMTAEDFPKCIGTDYTNNMNKTFESYNVPSADRIVLHFSADSYLESGYDYICVYAGDTADEKNLVGKYTGSLAETVINVDASSFTIRMKTDDSVTKYGFEISCIDYYSLNNIEITPALGHSYGDWETVIEATCTTSGSKERSCDNCEAKETDTISAFGHSYGEWITKSEANCENNGIQEKTCDNCGDVKTNTLPALGHSYSLVDTVDPTCAEDGYDKYACERCENEYTKAISPRHRDTDNDGFCDFCNEPFAGVLDLVFVIDTTGSMGSEISVVKQNIINYANRLANSNIPYYIAVVDYRDFADRAESEDYPYSIVLDFSNDNDEILSGVNKLSLGNGGDIKETVYSGLINGLDELHWGENSVRKVILIGDAAPLDPEPNTNFTLEGVCEYLNNNDTSVYSISTGGSEVSEFAEIAEATGGESYVCSSDDAFNQVLTDIIDGIPESLHIHTYEESYIEATCTTVGITTYHCTGCGKDISTKTEPLGHDYSKEWTVDTEPTCTKVGLKSHHCSRCESKSDVTEIAANGHNYNDVVTEPTCTKEGYTTHTCSVCGDSYKDSAVPANGHKYGEWTTTSNPTCTATGKKERTCSVCSDIAYETISALGHDYSEDWTVDAEPTCTKTGLKSHHCSRCDSKSDVTLISANGHNYNDVVTEPTCTKEGYTTHTCSVCGDSYKDSAVPANGHKYGEWITTSAPTCTAAGKKERTCSACNSVAYEVISALGHDYSKDWTVDAEPTCTKTGSKSHHCSRCDSKSDVTVIEKLAHSYGDWKVDYESTCKKEGKKHKTCADCGYSMYEAIEIVAHTYDFEIVPPTYFEQGYTVYTCSVCGDTYNDTYVDPLDRIDLSNATLELEYTSVYYEGRALTPDVTLTYEGETFDSSKELKITYTNNNRVGTATVTIEGINKFEGTVELQFEISYEVIPEQIVNVIAIGEIGKVSLSWGESSEVNTDRYNIYRKADDETEYQLIKTVNGRTALSYEDKNVEKLKTYSYYVTGIGLYGAESEPSSIVTATVLVDEVAPTVLKVSPAAASVISGKTTLSATATDNIGVTKIAYSYTLDNGENWFAIGETTNKAFSIVFDTSDLGSESVKVKAIAYDAEGNESEPIMVVYSLDNVGPEKVIGLSAVTLSSKITLSWNDVTANDAAYFILQTKSGEKWTTVAKQITTLGYTITGLQPDTDYIYRVACVDTHGNIGEYSDEFTARTAVDETAPVITNQSPNSARYNSTIKFSATAKDDCDVETIEIQVSNDLSSWTTVSIKTYTTRTYKQTYTYTLDLSAYAEESIFVRAIATDFSGNISDTGDAAPYTEYIVDKTAPKAPTGVSANGNDGYITVSWNMGSEADLGKYFVYKSTSLDGNYQLVASNLSTLNYHDRNVQSGREFYYKIKVSDTCGNMSEYSNAASATMSPDTQSPEITSISSTYQQKISSNTHTINVAATDNNKLSCIIVEYCTSANPEYSQLVTEENINNHYKSISVTLPIDDLTDGEVIYLRAYAVDMAGLQSEYATAKYTLDTTPPMVEDYSALLEVSTVYLDWKDNGESDLSGFKVYRSVDGEVFTLLGSRGVNSSGYYSFVDTITDKESNTYIYKLVSIDRLGNTASWLKSVDYTYVYVNQAPIAQMSIPDFMTVGVEEIFDASGSTDDIEIISCLWDFGDDTTSTEMKPVKSYDAVGTYTVKLSVTDNEGITSTITKDIEVKERDSLGTLNVKVIDENGKSLSYVPVYFDLGSDNQKIIYTNASGVATLQMLSGTHTIGMYASGYLPVKKDAVVLANAIRTVTLTTVEEDIVTGNFEITRMTFDEIVAAGIDVYDPANQNVYSATVRVTYGSTPPLTINYVRNDDKIISYSVKDSNGSPVTHYTNSNGENRKITGITYIPSSQGDSDVVAIMDIPAEASYLKEFFDVRLHIINNASSEFTLEMNEVILNVPEGMTLMTSVSGDYSSSNNVKIDSIKGQETVTLAWVLRGDKAGEYDLSADFTGTLAEFNELVTARFETEEPIKVYGLEGVKFRILTADEIYNDTLYFNIELENERDIDIYMPSIGLTDKIANITESVLNDNAEGDFFTEAYILNAYIQTENGQKQYVPVTYDENGRATTAIETLAPGQKIVYEYVAYNAINYDGIAYFEKAAITEFEGVIDNIETGSFHKELYSFTDYSAKLDAILSRSDADVNAAFDYINTKSNYYYVNEAEDSLTNVCQALYSFTDLALNADISVFTQEEKRELIEQIILSILADSSSVQMAEELQAQKYLTSVRNIVKQTKAGLIGKCDEDILNAAFNEILSDSKSLATTYIREGEDAFYTELYNKIGAYGLAIVLDGGIKSFFSDIGVSTAEAFSSTLIKPTAFATGVIDALEKTQRDAYIAALLKMECNAEYSNYILDAIISNASSSGMSSVIIDVASDLKQQINSSMTECYDYVGQFCANLGKEVGKLALKSALKLAIKATPLSLAGKIFAPINQIFNFDSFYKQQDALDVYNAMSKNLIASFENSIDTRDEDTDFYSMCILKAICEIRLSGESEFKSFMNDYIEGKYALPLSEKTVLKQINKVMSTSYTSIDEWYDDVQYNIVHSRDVLFNVEGISELETPRAPVVTLDYDKLQTVQAFTPEYEYCFADGVWITCNNEPITFEVGSTPTILRVRKAATDTNLAGKINTVRIFARKDLSKLVTVKFDGANYLINNLSSNYNYQVAFTNDPEATVDWSKAQTIAGSDSVVKIGGVGEYSNIIIRSCQNTDLYETTSNPLRLIVSKKKPLNLIIDGSGTVAQTADSGCYFNGESIDLIATANAGCNFIGWYIDDVCVSTNEHYIVEMNDNLKVVAKFTGAKIKGIYIENLPTKLDYYENETLNTDGIKVIVEYNDNTTICVKQFTAEFASNAVGKSYVVVTYGGCSTSYDITINHKYTSVVTLPTCTEKGYTTYACSECGNTYIGDYIDANGHTGGTATCKAKAKCTACGESYGEIDSNNHKNIVIDKAVEATCSKTGLTEGSHCTDCEKVIVTQDEIAKLPHTGGTATCKAKAKCTACGESYGEIDSNNHTNIVTDKAVEATCNKTGLTEGSHCTDCEKVIVTQDEIAKLPHTGGTATCKAKAKCTACGESYGEIDSNNHTNIVTDKAVEATCSKTGLTAGSHCIDCNKVIASQKVTEKKPHNEEVIKAVDATCTESGLTEGKKCSVCGEILVAQKETAKIAHKYTAVVTPPTCTEKGCITYTCSCGDTYVGDEIAALGHYDNNGDGQCDSCGKNLSSTQVCSCMCHKSGFSGFIWKILKFFYKLFGTNKVCDCGTIHY